MQRAILIICFVLSLFIVIAVSAHEAHKKSQTKPSNQQTEQTRNRALQTPSPQKEGSGTEVMTTPPQPVPMPFSGSLSEHAHNKLVHVPIGLGIAGALFVFISLKKPEMLTAVRVLWFLAALGAGGAYLTGEAQEEPFEEGPLHEVVELHENLGIATGISLAIGFLISLSGRFNALKVLFAVIVLALISVTGYYGGLLAHS